MYEEKRFIGKKVNWLSVILKLLLLFLVIFLIWYIVYKHNNKNKASKVNGMSITDNLSYLEKQYREYFKNSTLPKNTNEVSKVSLEELIDSKKSREIYDKNGVKCSSSSSYGQLTKVYKDTYSLKVYLKCKNEADSVIVKLTGSDLKTVETVNNNKNNNNNNSNNTNTNNNNNNTNKNNTSNTNNNSANTTTTNNNSNKNTTNNSKTNTTNNNKTNTTNNNKTNTTTTNNNKTVTNNTTKTTNTNTNTTNNNSSTSTSTTTTTTTNNTTTTTKTNTTTTTNNGTTTSTSTSSSTTTTTPGKVEEPIDVEKITSDPSRITLTEYLLYKLGEPTLDEPKNVKSISTIVQVQYYKYCVGNDVYNCHRNFAKTKENEKAINDLLAGGYIEYPDHTEQYTVYYPIVDQIWYKEKAKEGYIYSGESRTHYRVD